MAKSPSTNQHRKLGFHRDTPGVNLAVVNKATPSSTSGSTPNEQTISINRDTLEKQSQSLARDSINADSVFQLLPDMELAEQVLVGSILSPKDMSTVELGFSLEEGLFDAEIMGDLLEVVRCYFKRTYKIDEQLDSMLEDALFKKGAHIQIVIPENSLDQLINTRSNISTEMYDDVKRRLQTGKPLGFLGHPRSQKVSLENYHPSANALPIDEVTRPGSKRALPYLSVSDNFDTLKLPVINQRQRSRRISDLVTRRTVSMESAASGLTPEQVDALYVKDHQQPRPTQVLYPSAYQTRPSSGHPLIITPPMEAVIPVCVPGKPSEHVGYFVLLDKNGRPVQRDGNRDYYGELSSSFSNNGREDSSQDIVKLTREAMGGQTSDSTQSVDELQKAYGEIIENDLVNRLRNGIYDEEFELGFTQEVYTLMLHRAMAAQQTQLLYIPAEFVMYMAFNHDEKGVGESLLKQSNLIANMRSVLLFAETMSGVRNAIGRKRATITVDPQDPDPQKTISDIQAAVVEAASRGFPLGSPDPGQTMDYLNRAGFDFAVNIEGGNYPTTRVEFDDYNTQTSAGNPELQDRLRRMHISGMGMNPEQIDPSQSPDFATSVVNNNLIMTRRVLRYQKRFTRHLTKFVQMFVTHSPSLINEIQKVIDEQKGRLTPEQKKSLKGETLIDDFINAIKVTLPSPDTTKVEQQLQAFEQYTMLIDRTLEAYINPDIFPDGYLQREERTIEQVTMVIRSYMQRRWLEQNNVTPELLQLLEMDKRTPAFNLLEIQEVVHGSLGEAIHRYLADLNKQQETWKKKYGEPEETVDDALDGGGQETSDMASEEDGDDTLDEEGGDDDFGEDNFDADSDDVLEDEESVEGGDNNETPEDVEEEEEDGSLDDEETL